jgi:hypothetical protein
MPGSPTSENRREAVYERRRRAMEEALDVRPRGSDDYLVLEVRNPIHGTGYSVLLPTYPSTDVVLCTCTDFARRGLGTCKHVEAALRWLRERPEVTNPSRKPSALASLWRGIDASVEAQATDPDPESLAWRKPGRWLFEKPRRS